MRIALLAGGDGWRALAPVTGMDVAAEMVRFLAGASAGGR
jgi:hypothetical protein